MRHAIPTALPAAIHRRRKETVVMPVIAIGCLVAISVGIGVLFLVNARFAGAAGPTTAFAELTTMQLAMQMYRIDAGAWPPQSAGLSVLAQPVPRGPYVVELPPADPWGRPYIYNRFGADPLPTISTLGADGKVGGVGADTDLVVFPAGPP